MSTTGAIILSVLFTFLLLGPFSAFAQKTLPLPEQEGPVKVGVTININKIYNINAIDATYDVDAYLVLHWQDQRLLEFFEEGETEIQYENEAASVVIATAIWFPTFELINVVGERESENKFLRIRGDTAIYHERFQSTFTSAMTFRRYPFDVQSFSLQIESFLYDKSKLEFVQPYFYTAELEHSMMEWDVLKHETFVTEELYDHLHGLYSSPVSFSRYHAEVIAKRKAGYYLWQVFLPLFLIVIVSWGVFWIKEFSDQLNTAFTLMLTVVAFNFYTGTLIPRLPYNTFIEVVVISGYVTISLAILMVILRHSGSNMKREQLIEFLFHQCRWFFPVCYVVFLVILIYNFLGW